MCMVTGATKAQHRTEPLQLRYLSQSDVESLGLSDEDVRGFTRWLVWSPKLNATIGYAIVHQDLSTQDGKAVTVALDTGPTTMKLAQLPFATPNRAR